ncbi:hypothetical protein BD410DRAFT_585650 [Rickenella mellea]|uniref:Uncharacterized protein n=1 Tax=Rickenella mellea TaxID=50990 RepID=A0A4Y7PP94_9AGAM|nr:hypothetical protein BD410DRAFT_585650 [Rickenella mellea]
MLITCMPKMLGNISREQWHGCAESKMGVRWHSLSHDKCSGSISSFWPSDRLRSPLFSSGHVDQSTRVWDDSERQPKLNQSAASICRISAPPCSYRLATNIIAGHEQPHACLSTPFGELGILKASKCANIGTSSCSFCQDILNGDAICKEVDLNVKFI